MIHYSLVLILASLMPCVLGIGGWFSGIGALIFGAAFFYRALVFARTRTTHDARRVLRMSLLFLPALLLLLGMDALWSATGDQHGRQQSRRQIGANDLSLIVAQRDAF